MPLLIPSCITFCLFFIPWCDWIYTICIRGGFKQWQWVAAPWSLRQPNCQRTLLAPENIMQMFFWLSVLYKLLKWVNIWIQFVAHGAPCHQQSPELETSDNSTAKATLPQSPQGTWQVHKHNWWIHTKFFSARVNLNQDSSKCMLLRGRARVDSRGGTGHKRMTKKKKTQNAAKELQRDTKQQNDEKVAHKDAM